jgi:GNAT superfamily N-acetyltransferase
MLESSGLRAAPVNIRPANRQDMPGLWEVRYAVRENTLTPGRIPDEELRRNIEEDGRGWVAEQGDRILGFVIGLNTGSVWALFVRPEAEGQGIATRLQDAMLAWYAQQPIDRLWLTTGPGTRAEKFYESHGWQFAVDCGADEVRFERDNRGPSVPESAAPLVPVVPHDS